jgi:enterochelin esterase-like enzyme
MKRVLLILLVLYACAPTWAQIADDSQPAASNVEGAEYPRIRPDLSAEFRLTAPTAQKVEVHVGGQIVELVKDAQGIWTGTSAPLVPGFHYYVFVVDGVSVNDPMSQTYYGLDREASAIEVPEHGVDFYDVKDVPHGDVRQHWYFSRITGAWRDCFVYTPPGYDTNPTMRYPVLYLQHGHGEDETGWIRQGHANFILDNLIAAGKAKPMIIVMDRGTAARAGSQVAPVFGPDAPAPGSAGSMKAMTDSSAVFEDVVTQDLIPMIDSTYRTIPDRDHRALAGLSMGGMQTFQIGFDHLDTFGYLGGFSGPPVAFLFGGQSVDLKTAFNGVLADPNAFNARVHLLWLGVGTAEPDPMHAGIEKFHDALTQAGIHHVFFESPGTAHEWQTWRRDLYDFAPRLFTAAIH